MVLSLKGFFLLFFTLTKAVFASYEFSHEDPHAATGIQTIITGPYKDGFWTATNMTQQHLPFLTSLYTNPNVMKSLGDGKTRTQQDAQNRINVLTNRSAQGLPMGAWVAFDDVTQQDLGLMVAGPHEKPGYSEISRIVSPHFQGNGVGGSMIETLVKYWAPTVKAIGERHDSSSLCKKFRCFNDQALSHLYVSSSPNNIASWKSQVRSGFQPMPVLDKDRPIFDFTASSPENYGDLNAILIKYLQYFPNIPHFIIDHEGQERTASFHKTYGDMRFHFEYAIP